MSDFSSSGVSCRGDAQGGPIIPFRHSRSIPVLGCTGADTWAFEQICIKANDEQVVSYRKRLEYEEKKRGLR